jgi:hypothetical protein
VSVAVRPRSFSPSSSALGLHPHGGRGLHASRAVHGSNHPPTYLAALPPGRARLATSPNLTGSSPTPKTIGIVAVAACPRCAGAGTMSLAAWSVHRRGPGGRHDGDAAPPCWRGAPGAAASDDLPVSANSCDTAVSRAAGFLHFPKKPFVANRAGCGRLTAQVIAHACVRHFWGRPEMF